MTDSNPEERAVLENLNRFIEISHKRINEGNVSAGVALNMTARIRRQLMALYGKESQIPSCLPARDQDNITNENAKEILSKRIRILEYFISELRQVGTLSFCSNIERRVFIGHGRSPLWRELKDFLQDRLGLDWDEFNRESVAGLPTFERIGSMLSCAKFAFLVMTAEDEHSDRSTHARQNVVHEVGLFQGRLGPRKAIILLEEGCEEFSNIVGLSQIRFPRSDISARFEEIRRVLEREAII